MHICTLDDCVETFVTATFTAIMLLLLSYTGLDSSTKVDVLRIFTQMIYG